MSESQEPGTQPGTQPGPGPGSPGRYQRSSGGLLAAMVVTVLAVIAFAGLRALTTDQRPTPVQTVDYVSAVRGARADNKLLVQVPQRLLQGWKATSVSYTTGIAPTWHLGFLTGSGKYVGIEEAQASIEELAQEHVDQAAQRGKDVTINAEKWQTWTDAGGDYAVARSARPAGSTTAESWLVVGTAPDSQIRAFAASLKGGTLRPAR